MPFYIKLLHKKVGTDIMFVKKRFWCLLLAFLVCFFISAQTTTFSNSSRITSSDGRYYAQLKSVELRDDYTFVTIGLTVTKPMSRLNYWTGGKLYTFLVVDDFKINLLGALSSDGKTYHSCLPSDGWGWDNVKVGETYSYTLVFESRIPPGYTDFSLHDNSGPTGHGFSFYHYTINNPSTNTTNYTTDKVTQNILESNDGICGIYKGNIGNKYTLACVKENGNYLLLYMDSETKFSWWKPCEAKATLTPSGTPGLFSVQWLMVTKGDLEEGFVGFDGSSMQVQLESTKELYLKIFPDATAVSNEWSGTGFALRNGYIVTNNHVVEGANHIYVHGIKGDFDNPLNAKVIATDSKNDLALIQIDDSGFSSFGTIPYGYRKGMADVGEDVFVLGYPLITTMGEELKLTSGIVSSKTGYQGDVSLYQISAPIQPGNSGGPLFDKNGNIIGVVCAKHSGAENVGYAIKTSYLNTLIDSSASSEILPTSNSVSSLSLSEKVKRIRDFVFMIHCTK